MGDVGNNRVSTAQFYEAQLKTNEAIAEMRRELVEEISKSERRILAQFEGYSEMHERVNTLKDNQKDLKDKVETLQRHQKWWGGGNSFLAVVAGIVGSMFGQR